jgi:Protein of unknown function (DUF3344)
MQYHMESTAGRKAGGWLAAGAAAAMVVTAVAAGAPAAAAAAGGRGPSAGQGAWGTIAARTGHDAHKSAAPGDMPNTLTPVYRALVQGGYVSAGIGMRNLGYGTIAITGIPARAKVVKAYLLWDILGNGTDPSFAQGTFADSPIQGTQWTSGADPCWGTDANYSYEADVTGLVTGNGSYSLSGFASGLTDGSDPWNGFPTPVPPLDEGASLVVVYRLNSMPQAAIQIDEGAVETQEGDTTTSTLTGFNAGTQPSATTTYIVADGQEPGNTAAFNGSILPAVGFPGAAPQAVANYSQGNLWDNVTADVSSLVPARAKSVTVGVTGNEDCLVDVGQVLSVENGSVLPSASSAVRQPTALSRAADKR